MSKLQTESQVCKIIKSEIVLKVKKSAVHQNTYTHLVSGCVISTELLEIN